MLDRGYLKSRGNAAYKRNYWLCVVAAFILAWAAGTSAGSGGSSSFRNFGNNSSYNSSYDSDSYYESFNDDNFDLNEIIEDTHGDNGYNTREFRQFLAIFGGIFLVVFIVVLIFSLALSIFVRNPLAVGCKRFFVVNSFENAKFNEVGFGFKKGQYMNIVKVEFMKKLFLFLWFLPALASLILGFVLAFTTDTIGLLFLFMFIYLGLLFLPIYKQYEYYMVDYILSEDPTIGYKDAIQQSKNMMNGYKWATFVLELSFIGWIILGVFTCGLLNIFMVSPYMNATFAELFLELRSKHFGPNVQPYYIPATVGGYGGYPQQGNPQQGYGQQPAGQQGYDNQYYMPSYPSTPYDPRNNYDSNESNSSGTNSYNSNEPYNPDQTIGGSDNNDPYGM